MNQKEHTKLPDVIGWYAPFDSFLYRYVLEKRIWGTKQITIFLLCSIGGNNNGNCKAIKALLYKS